MTKDNEVDGFQPTTKQTLLNDIKLMSVPRISNEEIPLFTVALILIAGCLLILGNFWSAAPTLSARCGAIIMALTVIVFPIEHLVRKAKIKKHMETLRPLLDEITEVRTSLTDYLYNLDTRTSRYFHCVTNTKVTTYFMLRQLEAALAEVISNLERLYAHPSASNFNAIHTRLRGDVEYRDGFEFNSGELFKISLTDAGTTIQSLIKDLETGIEALEDEIKFTREQFEQNPEGK